MKLLHDFGCVLYDLDTGPIFHFHVHGDMILNVVSKKFELYKFGIKKQD